MMTGTLPTQPAISFLRRNSRANLRGWAAGASRRLLPIAAVCLAACSDAASPTVRPTEAQIEGSYVLMTFRGVALPIAGLIQADTVFLRPDHSFVERTYRNYSVAPYADTAVANGTFSVSYDIPSAIPPADAIVIFTIVTETRSGGDKRPYAGLGAPGDISTYGFHTAASTLTIEDGVGTSLESRYNRQ